MASAGSDELRDELRAWLQTLTDLTGDSTDIPSSPPSSSEAGRPQDSEAPPAMADRLTQLQDCYDQLLGQFYAAIRYISTHHNASSLDPAPLPDNSSSTHQADSQPNNNNPDPSNHEAPPVTPSTQPTQPSDQPAQSTNAPPPSQDQQPSALPAEQRPDSPTTFAAAQRELARDLILKTKQIEYIISVLPGVENSQEKQEKRIEELNQQLKEAYKEREEAEKEREEMLEKVEDVIGAVRR